ncbi:methyltransferase family protein [Pseudonocardia kunmingensis]|uniref:Phospholipid methyltransferase n=1 Tax=Pseudonocardia kunmingensis TaxID=630975 RepID=A0A543E0Q7_9PSEU|nr:isoprenylcysteine carboxylmethyltransferase family protein [Pseudonocardia kunmingensis]TQM15168.1 phospholipid methyltransferase [Pseudonocardia kunmingensis]
MGADVRTRRRRAGLVSALFMAAGPGTVAGVVPYLLTRWERRDPVPGGVPAQVAGSVLVAIGGAAITSAFVRFVREGLGTPIPVAAPTELVVGGIYRHVRNPMYLALASAVLGQALLLGRARLLVYTGVMAVPVTAFVRLREEPALAAQFGEQYELYCENVPRWIPRRRPWEPPHRTVEP